MMRDLTGLNSRFVSYIHHDIDIMPKKSNFNSQNVTTGTSNIVSATIIIPHGMAVSITLRYLKQDVDIFEMFSRSEVMAASGNRNWATWVIYWNTVLVLLMVLLLEHNVLMASAKWAMKICGAAHLTVNMSTFESLISLNFSSWYRILQISVIHECTFISDSPFNTRNLCLMIIKTWDRAPSYHVSTWKESDPKRGPINKRHSQTEDPLTPDAVFSQKTKPSSTLVASIWVVAAAEHWSLSDFLQKVSPRQQQTISPWWSFARIEKMNQHMKNRMATPWNNCEVDAWEVDTGHDVSECIDHRSSTRIMHDAGCTPCTATDDSHRVGHGRDTSNPGPWQYIDKNALIPLSMAMLFSGLYV